MASYCYGMVTSLQYASMPLYASGFMGTSHLMFLEPLLVAHRELVRVPVLEILREVDAIICHARLFPYHCDVKRAIAYHAHELHNLMSRTRMDQTPSFKVIVFISGDRSSLLIEGTAVGVCLCH